MKYVVWGVIAVMVASAGCKKEQADPEQGGQKSLAELEAERRASIAKGEARLLEQAVKRLGGQEPLLERHYEVLLTGVKGCEVKASGSYIDTTCPEYVRFHTARSRFNKTIPKPAVMWTKIAQKHVTHEAVAVRVLSIRLLLSLVGGEPAIHRELAKAYEEEESEVVRAVIVRSLWSKVGSSPEVAALMLKATKDPSPLVRRDAAVGIASMWARGVDGMEGRIREMMADETQPMEVRKALCEQMGTQANEALLPLISAYAAIPAPEPELLESCMAGLILMWSDPMAAKVPSQKAYRLTLERLGGDKRSAEFPQRRLIALLGRAMSQPFLAKTSWYDPQEVAALLKSIATDPQVYVRVRQDAVSALGRMEAAAAVLSQVQKELEGSGEQGGAKMQVLGQVGLEQKRLTREAGSP